MTKSSGLEFLAKNIEQVIQEHIAASRRAAEGAVAQAFAAPHAAECRGVSRLRATLAARRRTASEIGALGDQLYEAICGRPGETMSVLAQGMGASPQELQRPMACLKAAGRARTVGERHLTRYFPIAERAAAKSA